MERPKRNAMKKPDPNFVSPGSRITSPNKRTAEEPPPDEQPAKRSRKNSSHSEPTTPPSKKHKTPSSTGNKKHGTPSSSKLNDFTPTSRKHNSEKKFKDKSYRSEKKAKRDKSPLGLKLIIKLGKDRNNDSVHQKVTPSKTASENTKKGESQKKATPAKSSGGTTKKTPARRTAEKNSRSDPFDSHYRCKRSGCPIKKVVCYAMVAEKCSVSGYSARWYHLSGCEHYCNNCFEFIYRKSKLGFDMFNSWKDKWDARAKKEGNIAKYLLEEIIPYWTQCNKCYKWRQLPQNIELTSEFIRTYRCGDEAKSHYNAKPISCLTEEDKIVGKTMYSWWMPQHNLVPGLKKSPAAPFLVGYPPDDIGNNATETVETEGLPENFQPFCTPNDMNKALSFSPCETTQEEREEFPHFAKDNKMSKLYLGVRNLVLALWSLNCKEWLTFVRCTPHLICRGLMRIRVVQELSGIITFLTRKGYINTGILPKLLGGPSLPPEYNKHSVIVIGAGAAGLAAARQLHNFGTRVTLLEARSRLGGRVVDDRRMGMVLGKGAQIVTGCVNNPVSYLSHQLDLPMKTIGEECELINEAGELTEARLDHRMEIHFNALLDNISEWRRCQKQQTDTSLLGIIQEMHKQFLEEFPHSFSEVEEQLLNFHISNMEYACGCSLDKVSAFYWDQNESFSQFTGSHCLIQDGYSTILAGLAKNIKDVHLNTEVKSIDYSGNGVVVKTRNGEVFVADKVLVTLPLTVLRNRNVDFIPPLPKVKVAAIKSIGAGIVEKVALQFPYKFWSKKVEGASVFGHVPPSMEERGRFTVFYDMSPEERRDSPAVLMSYLSGESIHLVKPLTSDSVENADGGFVKAKHKDKSYKKKKYKHDSPEGRSKAEPVTNCSANLDTESVMNSSMDMDTVHDTTIKQEAKSQMDVEMDADFDTDNKTTDAHDSMDTSQDTVRLEEAVNTKTCKTEPAFDDMEQEPEISSETDRKMEGAENNNIDSFLKKDDERETPRATLDEVNDESNTAGGLSRVRLDLADSEDEKNTTTDSDAMLVDKPSGVPAEVTIDTDIVVSEHDSVMKSDSEIPAELTNVKMEGVMEDNSENLTEQAKEETQLNEKESSLVPDNESNQVEPMAENENDGEKVNDISDEHLSSDVIETSGPCVDVNSLSSLVPDNESNQVEPMAENENDGEKVNDISDEHITSDVIETSGPCVDVNSLSSLVPDNESNQVEPMAENENDGEKVNDISDEHITSDVIETSGPCVDVNSLSSLVPDNESNQVEPMAENENDGEKVNDISDEHITSDVIETSGPCVDVDRFDNVKNEHSDSDKVECNEQKPLEKIAVELSNSNKTAETKTINDNIEAVVDRENKNDCESENTVNKERTIENKNMENCEETDNVKNKDTALENESLENTASLEDKTTTDQTGSENTDNNIEKENTEKSTPEHTENVNLEDNIELENTQKTTPEHTENDNTVGNIELEITQKTSPEHTENENIVNNIELENTQKTTPEHAQTENLESNNGNQILETTEKASKVDDDIKNVVENETDNKNEFIENRIEQEIEQGNESKETVVDRESENVEMIIDDSEEVTTESLIKESNAIEMEITEERELSVSQESTKDVCDQTETVVEKNTDMSNNIPQSNNAVESLEILGDIKDDPLNSLDNSELSQIPGVDLEQDAEAVSQTAVDLQPEVDASGSSDTLVTVNSKTGVDENGKKPDDRTAEELQEKLCVPEKSTDHDLSEPKVETTHTAIHSESKDISRESGKSKSDRYLLEQLTNAGLDTKFPHVKDNEHSCQKNNTMSGSPSKDQSPAKRPRRIKKPKVEIDTKTKVPIKKEHKQKDTSSDHKLKNRTESSQVEPDPNNDEFVISMCMDILKKMFPEEDIPRPIRHFVTRWQYDKYAGMSYSYLPVGVSGKVYDDMAETINDKVYFAGEATNRQFPQTVTGAYLSGLREAEKIVLASRRSSSS